MTSDQIFLRSGVTSDALRVIDLGRLAYAPAYQAQQDHLAEVLHARDAGRPEIGRLLLVEHDPVITIGRHPGAARHLIASPDLLAKNGVEAVETDRGGDVTYHGPGQLVAYPILDLNFLNLGLHAYMRLLESAVIDAVARFGVRAFRDPDATGVWAETNQHISKAAKQQTVQASMDAPAQSLTPSPPHRLTASRTAKLCAMGVRVRRWVSMHGLALNVTTNLELFDLIVPCGLAGRPVTSLRELLGDRCPPMEEVKEALVESLSHAIGAARREAVRRRELSRASG